MYLGILTNFILGHWQCNFICVVALSRLSITTSMNDSGIDDVLFTYPQTSFNIYPTPILNETVMFDNNGTVFPQYFNGTTTYMPAENETYYLNYEVVENYFDKWVVDLLQMAKTRVFLSTFTNLEQRHVIEQQLRLCPYTPLCKFSFNLTVTDYMMGPCCKECSCDVDCEMMNTCCPDFITDYNDTINGEKDVMYVCSHLELLQKNESNDVLGWNGHGALMISRCQEYTNIQLDYNCTRHYTAEMTSFKDFLPVTSTFLNVTYRNQYCASCNGRDGNEILFWSPHFVCDFHQWYSTDQLYIERVLSDRKCKLFFHTDYVKPTECTFSISECNVTGLWESRDVTIERACIAFTSVTNSGEYGKSNYKNAFCLQCNGEIFYNKKCYIDPRVPSLGFPFSGLLRYDRHDYTQLDNVIVCNDSSVWDKHTRQCRPLFCSKLTRQPGDGRCNKIYTAVKNIVYHIHIRLKPTQEMTILEAYVMADSIIPWFETALINVSNNTNANLCGAQVMYIASSQSGTDHPEVEDVINDTLLYYEVRFEVTYTSYHDPDLFVDIIQKITETDVILTFPDTTATINSQTNVYVNGKSITFVANIYDGVNIWFDLIGYRSKGAYSDFDHAENERIPFQDVTDKALIDLTFSVASYFHIKWNDEFGQCYYIYKYDNSVVVRILELRACPMIMITNTGPFYWNMTQDGITFMNNNLHLKQSEYHFYNDTRDAIVLCLETYEKLFKDTIKQNVSFSLESLVSVICVTISAVCLVITIVTFLLFRDLRTLPGKNNLALSISLLIAQIVFVIGSQARFDQLSIACKVIGLLIHFFWLQSLFWMNVCTYHTYKVFANSLSTVPYGGLKAHLKYHAVTIIMSILFVSINIVVSLVTSDYTYVGYGGKICYISTMLMQEVTFGVPVALVVIANIIMFIVVIVKIKSLPNITRSVKRERNTVVIFAKLSTLTGLTWIFGFLFSWTGVVVFSYIFTVLSGGQGLFIMISFVLNRRVYNLYNGRFSRISFSD